MRQLKHSVPVTVNATVIAGSVTGGSSICAGSSTPFISSGTAGGVWSSDNTNAAIVDANSGVVTGINAGSANIIYTVTGCGGPLSAQKSITITTAATAGTIGGASSVCAGSITPFTTDGTAGGAWSSDNTSVAIVDAATGVVTGVNAGSATITYRVTGCGTFTTTKSITVTNSSYCRNNRWCICSVRWFSNTIYY
ncbi:MAG: Ig-like domain-containing protein [Bacteroidota bacterium]